VGIERSRDLLAAKLREKKIRAESKLAGANTLASAARAKKAVIIIPSVNTLLYAF
jgi:hypothetical protein